jgi:hypothetical protein
MGHGKNRRIGYGELIRGNNIGGSKFIFKNAFKAEVVRLEKKCVLGHSYRASRL